ncbi:MAG: hypothetical protein AAB426_05635 [Myxococcota bacterium]
MTRAMQRWLVAMVCLAGAASSRSALAQDLLPHLSPGPLTQAHAKWDATTGCTACHRAAGTGRLACLECHTHDNIQNDIATRHGLHGTFTQPCQTCHKEHKGRTFDIVDWSGVGGGTSFDHRRTGFALTGMHDKVLCTACHKQRRASGRASYLGLSPKCDDCHKNPHKFTSEKLRTQCSLCHVPGVASRGLKANQVSFDHAVETSFALAGKHAVTRCVDCHKKAIMSAPSKRGCPDCHKSPHGATYKQRPCTDCHDGAAAWKAATFDHTQARFPLEGRHVKVACKQCHKSAKALPAMRCNDCHKNPHAKRFAALRCDDCHGTGSLGARSFDHTKDGRYELEGAHARVRCRACHRGDKPTQFEKLADHECAHCHAHAKAHDGQLADKPCAACHVGSGQKGLKFAHNRDSRFALVGKHAQIAEAAQCIRCHPAGKYRTGQLTCVACHKDPHAGKLGVECEKCHAPDKPFRTSTFDHTRAAFSTAGVHAKLRCEKCHPDRTFKTGKIRCHDCHAKDEPHKGKLGNDCEKCHTGEKGAPKFAHGAMTAFALTGAHEQVACGFCHRAALPSGPPKVGWTQGLPEPKVDRLFPVMGKSCNACHADHHAGRYGTACQSCHRTTKFSDVSATMHDTGAFRLEGIHQTLPCDRCHGGERLLAGSGEICQRCHLDDDTHRSALGPFCGDCHWQVDWHANKLSHLQTGFPLRGAHRTVACDGCHVLGTYLGIPTDCEACHSQDAARVIDPVHTAELTPCTRCHAETGFVPVRGDHPLFPLVGRHRFVSCRNCHIGGTYLGTPNTCDACHMARYLDPATTPNHASAGYSTACDDCHTPVGWRPARTP